VEVDEWLVDVDELLVELLDVDEWLVELSDSLVEL